MAWWEVPGSSESISDPHGREGIGVAQGHPGHDYPLILPSEDVEYLLADFYLSFDQPGDYGGVGDYEPPFRIHWLAGLGQGAPQMPIPTDNLGSVSASDSAYNSICSASASAMTEIVGEECYPIPRHLHDIMVVDSNNRVVFDSTDPFVTYDARD